MTPEPFIAYVKTVEAEILRLREQSGCDALSNPSVRQEFLSRIELLESRREFANLADSETIKGLGVFRKHELRAFFRLSGIYEGIFEGQALRLGDWLSLYRKEFESTDAEITLLAPIELVEFRQELMQFDTFLIRRYSEAELNQLLNQHTCRLFYPWAVVDTQLLASYWFIACKEKSPISQLTWPWNHELRPKYSPFVGAMKNAFRVLALCKWQERFFADVNVLISKGAREQQFASTYPNVPFTLRISSSLRESPSRGPDLSKLTLEPRIDPATEEEIGEFPIVVFDLSEYEPTGFFEFANNTEKLLNAVVEKQEWRFIDIALSFLEKGFIENGLDQLLWHITTVEALLGEKIESGLTALLKRRVASILGRTGIEQKELKKCFDNLYSLRSDYIHGNVKLTEREILHGEVAQAREFARCITLWMLFYLNHILASHKIDAAGLPSRENLLAVLDMDDSSRRQIKEMVSSLPQGFPGVHSWAASRD